MHVDEFMRKEFGLDDEDDSNKKSKTSPSKPAVSPRRTHQPRIAHRGQAPDQRSRGPQQLQLQQQQQHAMGGQFRRPIKQAPRSFQLASAG